MLDGGRGRDGKDHISNSNGNHSFQVKMIYVRHVFLHSIVHVKKLRLVHRLKEILKR